MLADDTRYHIYRAVAEHPGSDVTVTEIAERFSLHPNVARMHLAKLEQVGFVATGFRRSSGGGRPAKLYRLSDTVVNFGFPPRRYELLSRLALEALAAGGSREDALRVCRAEGLAEGRRALAGEVRAPTNEADAVEIVRRVADDQGLLPEVAWQGDELRVTMHNCAFGEVLSAEDDLVCAMHRAFLEGLLEIVTAGIGYLRFMPSACSISCGDDHCELLCSFAVEETPADQESRAVE